MKGMKSKKKFIIRLLSLVVVLLMLAAGAILREGKIFGQDIMKADAKQKVTNSDTLTIQSDGSLVINTTPLAKDVEGYGGAVPLRIHISKDGIVESIETLPNSETPDFFDSAKSILYRWQGKSIDKALAEKVDGVSGATFSSHAIIENMKRGLAYAQKALNQTEFADTESPTPITPWSVVAATAAIIVTLLGAIVPLFFHNRLWHYIQLALNVTVLGLWTGTFVSYTLFMHLFSGGIPLASLMNLIAPLIMVIVALVYPLAGRKGHYCAHLCPFGSAQELAGKISKRKLHLSPRLNKVLSVFRNLLWAVLMLLMLTGTWTAWMDYELFTAFLYSSASVWVVAVAVLFLTVSVWIPRPYCRFICPTGTLIRI